MSSLLSASLPAPAYRGKVRDVHDLGNRLLIVASDRISAFDVIFDEEIPEKGRILNTLSAWWFARPELRAIVPHHCLSTLLADYPEPFRSCRSLEGRSMLVTKARRVDFECVARGYLAGSAWKEYRANGTIHGEKMAEGLVESSRLPEPLFTPATKAAEGHDENIPFARMRAELGPLADKLRALTLALFAAASKHAESRGLILADTKFEFGLLPDDSVILIDEALTPDSSRYWAADSWRPGRAQDPFDKQFLRDYLETLDWNKQPPPPPLPASVIQGTQDRYKEAYLRITGREWA
ncbi:MAG: phosphoribosylaminoimidazolesuccinocarboxamide synthase [Candidatus Hydrogenedentota bacterium]